MTMAPTLPQPREEAGLFARGRGRRVLVLSARFGGGHRSTAEAIRHWWERHVPDSDLRVLDHYDEFVNPVITETASVGYTQSVRLFPPAYHLFYEATRQLQPSSPAQQWLNSIGKRGLAAYLERERPDLIVAVHPTPAGALAEMRLDGSLDVPVVTVVTDYVVHAQWIHPGTDLYLVGSEGVRSGLARRGVPEEAIRVTGIPVQANTALLEQRDALREKWNLKPGLLTLLVMTGAQGMMRRPWRLFRTIASRPVQGFFLCGKDRALLSRLKLREERYPDFRIMPFVRIVPELMCVSDLLISKAGGLTVSEALAMELPMIIFHPIPGQEFANRDYLLQAGAAMAADTMGDLGAALDELCRRPERLEAMRAATRTIRRPDAARDAGLEMLRLLAGS